MLRPRSLLLLLAPPLAAYAGWSPEPVVAPIPELVCIQEDSPEAAQESTDAPEDVHAAWRERLAPDGRGVYLENVEGNTCLDCHATIGEEWRHSTHATSWTDEKYQKELKSIRRKKTCWGCHAPEPLLGKAGGGTPEARATVRHLGVTCTTCHLGADGDVLGPEGIANDAHASTEHFLFDSEAGSDLCLSCHDTTIGPVIGLAKDFTESGLQDFGDSCVGCHMPAIRRAWAEDPNTGEPTPARPGRSHRLEGPRDPLFLASAFDLKAVVEAERGVLVLTNATGHRVPGLVERELRFVVELLDAAGEVRGKAEHAFDHRNYLPVEEEHRIVVEGTQGARLRVTAWHDAPGMKDPVRFVERELKP